MDTCVLCHIRVSYWPPSIKLYIGYDHRESDMTVLQITVNYIINIFDS